MNSDLERQEVNIRQSYFFLSYAHSPPLAGSQLVQPDVRVHAFFEDLSQAVQRHARLRPRLTAGYFDQDMPPSPSRRAALELAIGAAEVFVPLYSPAYLTRTWPGREWACFEARVTAAGVADPLRRFAALLWTPLPPGQQLPGLYPADELLPIAAARTYADHGLLMLMRLAPYRDIYEQVVDRLATHIVRTAEMAPIGPSTVPDISQVQSKFTPGSGAPLFVVAVATLAQQKQGEDSDPIAYAMSGSVWRPFGSDDEPSLAEHAAIVAEQLDFAVQVTEIDTIGALLDHAPGTMLIDPRYVADDRRMDVFRHVVADLPPWVLPVLVRSKGRDAQEAQLARTVRQLLGKAHSEPARHALRGVSSLQAFLKLMPFLVTEAERQYLRRGPLQRAALDPRPTHRADEIVAVVPGPQSRARPAELPGYVFISYVREDLDQVHRLQLRLQASGVPVWQDLTKISPGDDWRARIRDVINNDTIAFLACFSKKGIAQETTFQNEELQIATEQLRQRRPDNPWFIPIRFDECDIPDLDIGGGRTLRYFNQADLFGDHYEENIMRLVDAVVRILARHQDFRMHGL